MEHYKIIHLINSLPISLDISNKIIIDYKYHVLEKNYIINFKDLNKHLLYYSWLNKMLLKKNHIQQSLLNTIKEYDYYSKKNKVRLIR